MISFEEFLNESVKLNQAAGGVILGKMLGANALSDKSKRFLGITDKRSLSFGPQSSAQAYIESEFPKAGDYYNRGYDMTRKEFLDDGAKEKEVALKTRFMTALKKANKEDVLDSYEAINKILELGADIFSHNSALANDPKRGWALLDKSISGKDIEDLKMKKW